MGPSDSTAYYRLPTTDYRRPTVPLRKYFNIFRLSLIERLTYRGDFLLGTVLRFLPMLTTILLWQAIYAGANEAGPNSEGLGGFRLNEMISYLLLVHISRMFSSMPGLDAGIARDIRQGTLKKYLLQPIHMIAYLVAYRIAHKIAYIVTACLPYALLFFLCRSFFPPFPDGITVLAYAASLVMGFVVGFFMQACIGMVGFWLLEVTSLFYVMNTVNFFVSGHMFPLDLLPPFWAAVLKALPFQYLAYFPAAVFLGKIEGWDLVIALLVQLAWALTFMLLSLALYHWGLKRYSAYGG
jgi:ABC-2 type transport system permease protein